MRTICTLVILGGVLLCLAKGARAEMRQHTEVHSGVCDGTVHQNVPIWTNPFAHPVQIASTQLTMFAGGGQWGGLSRASDRLSLVFLVVTAEEPFVKRDKDVPAATVTLGVGDRIVLDHFCAPPDSYSIYAQVNWVQP